jgi:undecaprenyl diphosphate synthase
VNFFMVHDPQTYARSVGLDPARLPRHVAVIMDGNGRWAVDRGQERVFGHLRGADTVRTVTEECARLGLDQLTLYALSVENWKRPKPELDFLMALLKQYLADERPTLQKNDIRFAVIGRRAGLPADVLAEIDDCIRFTADHRGLRLCLAINYGGRTELVDAARALAAKAVRRELQPDAIDEADVTASLYTAGMADPDLLIRTAGEMRVSNFLLWQISYAELWVTPTRWPDFGVETLHAALKEYAARDRRFGGLTRPAAC